LSNNLENERRELLGLLKRLSYRRGKVVLASGRTSDFYIDCRQTALNARGHVLIGRLLFDLIHRNFPEAVGVGGPTLGADPLVSAVSLTSSLQEHPLHGFLVRKEAKSHGTGSFVEGLANLEQGSPVVVVEDVITSGGSILRAAERVAEAGLQVAGLVVLVDRQEGGRQVIEQAGHRLLSLFDRSDFL